MGFHWLHAIRRFPSSVISWVAAIIEKILGSTSLKIATSLVRLHLPLPGEEHSWILKNSFLRNKNLRLSVLSLPLLSQSKSQRQRAQHLLSSTFQPTVSWETQQTLLTRAMVLVAQKSLTFSLFESSEFRDFIRTAIDLGKRYVPVTSYSLKQHIETVYDETKSDVRRFYCVTREDSIFQ